MILKSFIRHRESIAIVMTSLFLSDLIGWNVAYAGAHTNPFENYRFAQRNTETVSQPGLFDFNQGMSGVRDTKPIEQGSEQINQEVEVTAQDKADIGGPGQPEMQAFQSVGANNLVNLFTGDFSYNIPLLDVGGYPLGLSYSAGISMDQEASWVGLGWNINPGSILRNVRGLPDDFNGTDSITKELNTKPKWAAGVTADVSPEILSKKLPIKSGNIGIYYDNYSGPGFIARVRSEGLNAGKFSLGSKTEGIGTVELDVTFNSQSGFNLNAAYSANIENSENKFIGGTAKVGLNYNSRAGLQDLQITGRKRLTDIINRDVTKKAPEESTLFSSSISFSSPTFSPTISMTTTSVAFTFSAKVGAEFLGFNPLVGLGGNYSRNYIAKEDRIQKLPAYGYLHLTRSMNDRKALMDFNREKDIPYRNNTPSIAVPIQTYDVFSVSGEGSGGTFRAYRGDAGFVRDHHVKSKSSSLNLGIDLGGIPNFVQWGAQIAYTNAFTENRPWDTENLIQNNLAFQNPDTTYESVYFRNPGEQTTNSLAYYNSIGDEDLIRVNLTGKDQYNPTASNILTRFDRFGNKNLFTINKPVVKANRDKRSQVMSYLNAHEASLIGLDKVIRSYKINQFPLGACDSNSYTTIKRNDGNVRKPHHISEVTILNPDGRTYVYGIPAYNLGEEEVTFSVNKSNANIDNGQVGYGANDMSDNNNQGKDGYYNKQITPPYAHSYLLTALKSTDYVDVTGNGITEDDLGDAVKFNYSRMHWSNNDSAFQWRTPTQESKASYDEGLRTDNSDDKGHVLFGKKEVWYLNSLESKTMIATFTLDTAAANLRKDAFEVKDIHGGRSTNPNRKLLRLKEINLYSKADLKKFGSNARPIKTVHFSYSYRLCKGYPDLQDTATGKLTLESVWFTYNKNQKGSKNRYVFNYGANPVYTNKSYDRWGNYKPAADNPGGMLPDEYPYAVKDSIVAGQNAAAWNLSEITLPSGAKMKVQYESDDYAFVQNKRANEMFQIAGFGHNSGGTYNENLYTSLGSDRRFVYIKVNSKVSSKTEVLEKYLKDQQKLYFRLNVEMPKNGYGSGSEYIPVYAGYKDFGRVNDSLIWVQLEESPEGNDKSPLATAAIQFLRFNLPSKAYYGSDIRNEPALKAAVMAVLSIVGEIKRLALGGFNSDARISSKSKVVTLTKSFVRLNSPDLKKMGGGYRVKKITIHDNWQKMTGKKESVYGQEYKYTTTRNVGGKIKIISSGVASYEPSLGNEENPFHQPVEYKEKATLAPSDFLYVEEPFAESLFPSAGVGYSKVRVSSINRKNVKSASGFEETEYYTAFDFPTLTQRSSFDDDSHKDGITPFSPFSADSKKFITLSQGFKIELNDMHGKTKSTAVYAETDSIHPMTFTAQYYKCEKISDESFRLVNKVATIDSSNGRINLSGQIGKDIELVTDMREQFSQVISPSLNLDNSKFFVPIPFVPFLVIPSACPEFSMERSRYRAVSMLKIVQRYGILDSVVHIDKGSKVSTRNLAWDGETGDVLLTETQNEFNDPVYQFQYPAHWAYSGVGPAYKNIDAVFKSVYISGGKVTRVNGSAAQKDIINRICESGDEILITNVPVILPTECVPYTIAGPYILPNYTKKIWVVDRSKVAGGAKDLYFIDREGKEYTGHVASLRIVRSGRRNISGTSLGSIVSLKSPIKTVSGVPRIVIDSTIDIVSAGSAVMKDVWTVEERMVKDTAKSIDRDDDGCDISTWSYGGSSSSLDLERVRFAHLFDTGVVHFPDSLYSRYASGGTWEDSMIVKQGNLQFPRVICNINNAFSWKTRIKHRYFNGGTPSIQLFFRLYTQGTTTNESLYYIYLGQNSWGGIWQPEENLDSAYASSQLQLDLTYWREIEVKFEGNKIKVYVDNVFKYERSYTGYAIKAGYFTVIPHHVDLFIDYEKLLNGSGATILDEEFEDACHLFAEVDPAYDCKDDCVSVFSKKINPYVQGLWGNWRGWRSYVYYDNRKESDPLQLTNIRKDGVIKSFVPFWTLSSTRMTPTTNTYKWVWNSEITRYNKRGLETENHDPLGRFNSGLYGYNNTLPVAVTQNARHRETAFEGFEDYSFATENCADCPPTRHLDFSAYKDSISTAQKHSGKASLRIGPADSAFIKVNVHAGSDSIYPGLAFNTVMKDTCKMFSKIQTNFGAIYPAFTPLPGKLMVMSAWVKEDKDCKCLSYTGNGIDFIFYQGDSLIGIVHKVPSGNIIEGWQRYEDTLAIPSTATYMLVKLRNSTNVPVYFDDLRLFPYNSNMKSFVYHPTNLRLLAELDENNYASFYEYDDEGTLIRVKKETERGVKTISETRSALRKTEE